MGALRRWNGDKTHLRTIELVLPRDPEEFHALQHFRLVRRTEELAHYLPNTRRVSSYYFLNYLFIEGKSRGLTGLNFNCLWGEAGKEGGKGKMTHIAPSIIRIKFSASA